jgi:hypothetical protein
MCGTPSGKILHPLSGIFLRWAKHDITNALRIILEKKRPTEQWILIRLFINITRACRAVDLNRPFIKITKLIELEIVI